MSGVEISIDGRPTQAGVIDVHQEWIDISTLSAQKPDARWTFLDGRGHFHAWDDDGKLPTLERRTRHIDPVVADEDDDDPDPEDLDDDSYDESFYACRICDEEIEPKYVPDYRDKVMPGRLSWTVEVDEALTRGAEVSIVVKTKGRTSFEVGTVRGLTSLGGGYVRSTIVGTGPLAVRTRPSKPAKPKKVKAA